jgi:serine/threonine-protein kinase RsbW
MEPALDRQTNFWNAVEPGRSPHAWQVQSLSSSDEIIPATSAVVAAMAEQGYKERDIFETTLIVSEALMNAVMHGNRANPRKLVVMSYLVALDRVLIDIQDEGTGFDPVSLPDPTLADNLENPGGRGLLLMRCYSTWLQFNRRGNRVMFCKVKERTEGLRQ